MEELLNQCLQEVATDAGFFGDIDRYLERHNTTRMAEELAAKLLAKGVQLPHNHGLIDITHLLD